MEGISGRMCRVLKKYWRRRGYQRLNGRRRNTVELGTTRTRRRWRIKMVRKIRIPTISSPKKVVLWVRDAYMRMMVGLANSTSVTGYGGFGRAPQPKEYDNKMIIHMYKSLIMAQAKLTPPPHDQPCKMASETACQR
ncbi:hypothetical protein SESBI_20312 [Sesbania bispinosa]|nr:hypothetical protein SESBI_20312 [Sesbania bispinosa]